MKHPNQEPTAKIDPPLKPRNRRERRAAAKQNQQPTTTPEASQLEAENDNPPPMTTNQPEAPEGAVSSDSSRDWDAIEAEFVAEAELAAEAAPETPLDMAEEAKLQKLQDAFYWGLCTVFHTANWVGFRKLPGGKLKSLDLKSYGDMGRAASDQLYDKLSEIEWLKKQLSKLDGIKKYIEQYKDIAVFAVSMNLAVKMELDQRRALQEKEAPAAANDNETDEENAA